MNMGGFYDIQEEAKKIGDVGLGGSGREERVITPYFFLPWIYVVFLQGSLTHSLTHPLKK